MLARPDLAYAHVAYASLGSAICRTAVARGWTVTSLSRSGKPYATAQGHAPAWVSKVCLIFRCCHRILLTWPV